MEILPQIFIFLLFVCLGAVLPGIFITLLFLKRSGKIPGPEALCAIALLSGFIFLIAFWAALRWVGADYNAVTIIHLALVAVLAVFSLRDSENRNRFYAVMKSIFSAETAVLLVAAVALAAYLTYDKVQLYYGDELFRMSLVWAAQKSIPAQNMLVHSGIMHYYYATEFFAGSVASITRIPLETVYLRFMLPLNWILLYFGMKGILAQHKPDFKRYIPHAAFLLFFVAHVNMLTHFTFRQNTFALGLSVLGMSALWTALSSGAAYPLLICCVAPAFITLAKAPCGALCMLFFCLSVILGARSGLIGRKRAAVAVLLGTAAWVLAYKSLSGQGFQDADSLLRIGVVAGSLQELLPEYIVNPGLLAVLPVEFGFPGSIMGAALQTIENSLSVLVIGIVPLIAAISWFYCTNKRRNARLPDPVRIVMISAVIVFMTGAVFYCFVHYRIIHGSDRYWLFFSIWMLSAVGYPLLLEELVPWFSLRRLALLAFIPAVDLLASLSINLGYTKRFFGLIPKTFEFGIAILVLGIVPAVAAWFWLYSGNAKRDALIGLKKITAASALGFLLAGVAVFVFLHYRIYFGAHKNMLFFATWLLAASIYPLFLYEFSPRTGLGLIAVFSLIPVTVALSHAPKYSYWASELKSYNGEGWTQDNQLACDILNSSGEDGELYIHTRLNGRVWALAAMCRKRMYVSGRGNYEGVWEDRKMYSAARSEAVDFFNGKMPQPCFWLKKKGIGYVYWDAIGSPFKFPEMVKSMTFLDKIYRGGNVALYAVGSCGEKTKHSNTGAGTGNIR